MRFRFSLAISGIVCLVGALPANAALVELYNQTGLTGVDAAFENTGGWLQTTYGLPNITRPNGIQQTTVLPQVELAVAQLARNNANGLTLPTAASGIPGVSYPISGGGTGTGVWDALTNHGPVGNGTNGGGSVSGSLTNFDGTARNISFTFSRTDNVVSYTAGGKTWTSAAQEYFKNIDALEFRIRSTNGNSESYTNLLYNGSSIADISAANGNVTVALFGGVAGDFTLSGVFNTTGNSTGWNSQIKALDLPTQNVPEPSTLIGASLGLAALGLRRLWSSRAALSETSPS